MSFAKILKGADKEGKEKHVPVIEIDKDSSEEPNIVRVIVGKEVPHPNTVEHHIVWIELYGVKKGGQVICLGRVDLAPVYSKPDVRFFVPVSEFSSFHALEYCNIHGVWESALEV
ncbi:class II SORL domain-containing protein [Candidatus Sumerlaeota bacterium]|nr:class II SORL domain-containing protein [Candidatus Sumerlaeota bacterium]